MWNYKLKLWLGVGTAALASGAVAAQEPATNKTMAQPDSVLVAVRGEARSYSDSVDDGVVQLASKATDGGEGGEGAATTHGHMDNPVAFVTGMYRIEAQLRAGIDQYERGHQAQSIRHFDTVVAMIAGPVGVMLEAQGFEREHVLIEAEALPMSARDADPMEDVLDYLGHLLHELDEHALLVPAEMRRDPDFRIPVAINLLHLARENYSALEQPGNSAEDRLFLYESARSLVRTGRDIIGMNASTLRDRDPERFDAVLTVFAGLSRELTALTPTTEMVSQSVVLSRLSTIEGSLWPMAQPLPESSGD